MKIRKRIICVFISLLILASSVVLFGCQKSDGDTAADVESGVFDPDDWTGEESDIPQDNTTYSPTDYVTPVRQDGENDDSPAIKRALEQIKATGGTIYFPKSNYVISEPIIIYKNITYVGRGVNQTKITVASGAN